MPSQHKGSVAWSVALHVALLAALTLTFRWPSSPRVTAVPAPIQGMIVDQSVLDREQQRRDQVARTEQQRRQREERQKREDAEQQRREKDEAVKREQERVAQQQREREQVEREKAEAAKREQERVAQAKRDAEAQEKREREEAARKQKEAAVARQRAQAEKELQEQLAAESARMQAERAGVLDEYIRLIEDKIERNWSPPLSAKAGLECVVNVVQIPSGDVMDVRVGRCNGDDAVVRSIEAAVRKASPLPKPPSQAVFERNLIVTFKPDI